MTFSALLSYLTLTLLPLAKCFPNLAYGYADALAQVSASVGVSVAVSASAPNPSPSATWSASQLVDVTGIHAYQDPQPGQARGPCPAQNALANHAYLDRSGFTTVLDCIAANVEVFSLGYDIAGVLCLRGQLTGGSLSGVTFSIGNTSAVQSSIQDSCPGGLLGILTSLSCLASTLLSTALGLASDGMAQTHNLFESDSSFLQPDWGTINGIDASTLDMSQVNKLWTQRQPDGTFDDFSIIVDWASYRKTYCISTNPCYFRDDATILASLGAYTFIPTIYANHTPERPSGTLSSSTFASFFGLMVDGNGNNPTFKGFGKEQIPDNWYKRPTLFTAVDFTLKMEKFFAYDPSLISIGGNTNGVNTFTGLDVGNLTGGVVNGANLLEGRNLWCVDYAILTANLKTSLLSVVGASLGAIAPTLQGVLDAIYASVTESSGGLAACPSFTYNDIHNFPHFCGVRQQTGGLT